MTSKLGFKNYINYYFFHPLSISLNVHDKIKALAATILLSVCSAFMIPIVVGIYQWANRFKQIRLDIPTSNFLTIHQRIHKIGKETFVFSTSNDETSNRLKRSNFAKRMENEVLTPFYRECHPQKNEIPVPVIEELHLTPEQQAQIETLDTRPVIRYGLLTTQQKIALNNHFGRHHNQISKNASEHEVDEAILTKHGQSIFLENDPRGGHGCDHATRVSLWAAMFAYLYQKYDPTVSITEKDLLATQIIAACHDSGRFSEGTDVYDDISADRTLKTLNNLGITDPGLLDAAKHAVADKDSDPLDPNKPKPVIARIVQNSDSADFTRIFLKSPQQENNSFANSLTFLDIFKEMQARSNGDPSFVLKNGLTYGDFLEELKVLMAEKNSLTFKTHQKGFREQASNPAKNYYNEVLSQISFTEYPNLYYVLSTVKVIQGHSQRDLVAFADTVRYHANELTVDMMRGKIAELRQFPPSQLRDEIIQKFEKKIKKKEASHPLPSDETLVDELELSVPPNNWDAAFVRALRERIDHLDTALLSSEKMTELAVVFDRIIHFYTSNDPAQLSAVLKECAKKITLHQTTPLMKLLNNPSKIPIKTPLFIHAGSDSVRKRQLRVQRIKHVEKGEHLSISLEMRGPARLKYDQVLNALQTNPPQGITVERSEMQFDLEQDTGTFTSQTSVKTASSLIIKKGAISLEIGTDKHWWTCYQLAKIEAPFDIDPAEIQAFLAEIGLPSVLAQSRDVDVKREFRNKMIQTRFPEELFQGTSENPYIDLDHIYDNLSPEKKAIIDHDIEAMQLKEVVSGYQEFVNPNLPRELRNVGARGFISNLVSDSIENAAKSLVSILRSGSFLSSMERYQRGILGAGTCPQYNITHGSANQFFARLLTESYLNDPDLLAKASYSQISIFFIFDIQAAERAPYAYPADYSGMRNPFYNVPHYKIHSLRDENTGKLHAKEVKNAKGSNLMKGRITLNALAQTLTAPNKKPLIGNEVMFERGLSTKYIQNIAVPANLRESLIALLQAYGINEINGKSLSDIFIPLTNVNNTLFQGGS